MAKVPGYQRKHYQQSRLDQFLFLSTECYVLGDSTAYPRSGLCEQTSSTALGGIRGARKDATG